ncbi:MAG: hypothetical protein LC117_08045 [Bacteroidia bacterium]|nr:hypothetical protein [Bacteroidia bacterium]MCZ2277863.1 hypothetical protein [Bacteroidia bacterium]
MNKIKERKQKTEKQKEVQDLNLLIVRYLRAINIFGKLRMELIISIIPFLFFIVFLAMLLIGNSFYTERLIRNIDRTGKEIKELQSEFITGRSDLMFRTNQSQVAAMVEPNGLFESRVAPFKLVINSSNNKKDKK